MKIDFIRNKLNEPLMIIDTPTPPYYAVIFTSVKTDLVDGYQKMNEKMNKLVSVQEGFLGVESVGENKGITISYWKDLNSIKIWKDNIEHSKAQYLGKSKWYKSYKIRIAKVEREYGFNN
jgi:heme-degrading monooxygenase HmoA